MSQYEARLVEIHDLVEAKDLSVVVDSQADQMERLKTQLAEFAKLSEDWEKDRLQKNEVIEEMKEQLVGFEEWRNEKKIYEEKQKLLEEELEAERQSSNQRLEKILRIFAHGNPPEGINHCGLPFCRKVHKWENVLISHPNEMELCECPKFLYVMGVKTRSRID